MGRSCRSWLIAAALLLPLSPTSAQEPAGVCSLSWPGVIDAFGAGTGWRTASPPIPLWITGEDAPDHQALFFQSADGQRAAVIVAEWGEPDSPELGSVVYCAVHDVHGRALEEIGTPPWALAPDPDLLDDDAVAV